MVRSTDRPAMTIAVDLGRKVTKTNKPSIKGILLTVPMWCFFCGSFLLFMFRVCHAFLSVHLCHTLNINHSGNFQKLLNDSTYPQKFLLAWKKF